MFFLLKYRIVKLSFTLGLTFLCHISKTQEIQYHDTLTFGVHFFAENPYLNGNAAGISTTIRFVEKNLYKDSIILSVFAIVSPQKSWILDEYKSDKRILQHEEYHFRLSEVFARRLKEKLSESIVKYSNFRQFIRTQYSSFRNDLRACQEEYDLETSHGVNYEEQKKWELYIDTELNRLTQFSNSDVLILVAPH